MLSTIYSINNFNVGDIIEAEFQGPMANEVIGRQRKSKAAMTIRGNIILLATDKWQDPYVCCQSNETQSKKDKYSNCKSLCLLILQKKIKVRVLGVAGHPPWISLSMLEPQEVIDYRYQDLNISDYSSIMIAIQILHKLFD
ncbi:6582_t:CDS:1 [Cetraspora pellucida]|uniref:6582_t:CDS:1 n=1 Tax=Cetraspora pellucida TaxID=1433469 RepID=A0A9N9NXU0_9GLOM|nr:6582_t:CDS:1 [Cetraspora pellucida]